MLIKSLSKKIGILILFFVFASSSASAQNVTIGASNYTTLKAAFDAINAGVHTGAIVATVNLSTTETATAQLNSSGTGAANYTSVLVRPSATVTISGNLATSIIKLAGADNVTIDGINGGSQMTITNTSTSTAASVIWVASASASNGATNNIIRNCVITGNGPTTTGFGISSSGSTANGSVAETANSNNTYQNNTINTCRAGIVLVGPTGNESGNIISNNSIGSVNAGNKLGFTGIGIAQQQNVLISQNTIFGVTSTAGSTTFQTSGILVIGTISGGLIERNIISDIKMTDFWGCSGILLQSSSASTNLTVANNFVFDVTAGGFTDANSIDDGGYGISINTGNGYNIYYNSVDMSTDMTGSSSDPTLTISAAFWIAPGITGTNNIRNNIFSNRQTTGIRYAVYCNSANTIFSTINFNDYYSVTSAVGFLGSARNSLAAWQTATGQDASSLTVNPLFIAVNNLHLQGTTPLDAFGTPIAGITIDIDGATRSATNPDIGADELTPPNCTSNAAGTATASSLTICASGTATLSATGFATGGGIAYQWEYFNGAIWVPLVGQTNPNSASIGTIGATTQYRLRVSCANCCGGAGSFSYSNVVTITVNNPQVTSTTPGSRCGVGTVNLAATAATGTIKWYAAPTGGTALFTGSPFTTPVIAATTNYYVSNAIVGTTISGGKASTTGADGTFNGTETGLVFTATSPFVLQSVRMYPQAAGEVTIQAVTSAGVLIPGCSVGFTFTGATSTGIVVPLNFTIPAGTNHRLILSSNFAGLGLWRDFNGLAFPYAVGSFASITTGWLGFNTNTYYYFYDWQAAEICEGLRTAVTATVTAPPAFSSVSPAAGPGRTICSGSSVNLNVTSANAYTYTWNPGNLSGAAQTVSPTTTTTYTVTGNDGTCRRDSAIVITVNTTPSALTINPATATSCANTIIPITATGGTMADQPLFTETFETFPLTQMAVTGSGVTAAANTTYYQQGVQSVLLTHSNSVDGQLAMSSSISLVGYTSPKLTFYQICGLEAGFDYGYVQYSTDGGTVWNNFAPADYAGSGVLKNGVISFDKSSYTDWNTQFSAAGSTPGTGPATSMWKKETINLAPYAAFANFRIRFRLTSDVSDIFYGWLIDNVLISGNAQAPVTWAPITELYTDALCTIPYAGAATTLVYARPTVSRIYTATATNPLNALCLSTGTSNITISAVAASVSITANPAGAICAGTPVTFTATPVNGGANPGYLWRVNGTQVNLPLGFNANPGHNPFTINGLNNGDVVTCQILSNAGGCVVPNNPTSAPIVMTVDPKPTVSINGPLSICFPAILTLTTTGTITTYEWFLNGGATGGNTPTLNAAGPGTYSCIVTSNNGCKDTAADKVLVQQTYTITATATNGTISPSGAVVVNCGANQSFTYTANPGYTLCDLIVDGVSQPGPPASPFTFTNVTANHTIEAQFCIPGCVTPSVAVAGNDTSICANVNYPLGGSISGPPGLNATWSTSGTGTFNPSNVFGTATSYTPSAGDILAGTVTLTLTTNNPLGPPCAPAFSTVTLTIKPIPVVNVTGNLGVCLVGTTTTTLTASATIASGTITGYQWFNSIPASIGVTAAQLITTAGTYSVTASASNGCSTNYSLIVSSYTSPSTPTITGSGTICIGTNTVLTANVASPGNGGASILPNAYQWSNPGVIVGAINQVYLASTPATYSVVVTNTNGCISTASAGFPVAYDNSPLNGAYTIGAGPASCTNYISFDAAINDLNTRFVAGNVRFDVQPGHVETAPSLGLKLGSAGLNASITATGASILFQKNGIGANPLINAYSGGTATAASPVPDGIWSLRGVDNVTINSIDLVDGNATNNATMEYGFGLFKLSTTDGAQDNTIINCNITLNRINIAAGSASVPMPDGSTGILVVNALATAANAALTPGGADGANSNNKFYGNTIQNCNTGIALMGYAAPNPYTLGDAGNDVGGLSAIDGNNILNYGGGGASTAVAVRANNQWGLNISYNTINNNNGFGINHTNILRGIWGQAGQQASVTINNNNITLNSSAVGALACVGIENAIGSTTGSNTVSISNNIVTGTYSTATTGTVTCILNTANATTVNINGNTIQNFNLGGTGNWIGIMNNIAGVPTLTLNNNTVKDCNITSTGTFTGISNNGAVTTSLTMSGNTVSGMTKNTTSVVNWMNTANITAAAILTMNDNVIVNNTVTAAATAVTMNCFNAGTSTYTFNNNYISNNAITGITTGVATVNGFNNTAIGALQDNITNNTIRRLYITGTSTSLHAIHGITTTSAASSNKTITNNNISNLYTSSGISSSIYGIRSVSGNTINISRNKIDSLFPGQSATAGAIAAGMRIQSGTAVNIFNNFINLDLTQATAPAANNVLTANEGIKGIEITVATAVTWNIYYNTIRLAGGGSGAAFGSSCVSIFNATPTIVLRNNILVNLATPGGVAAPAASVAYRRPAAVGATYSTLSNNNLFYAGTPSAARLLYYDVAVSYQTLAAYQAGAGIAPRESNSVSALPNFVSNSDLHLIPGSNCSTDGAAAPIVGYTTDYDTDTRDATTPDIGADEFAGTGVGVGVWKGINTDWNDIVNWCDAIPDAKTNVTIPAAVANYPLITTATPVANNITIALGGSVTITGAGKLAIYGTITNAGTFNVVDGTIEMAGSTAQTIPAGAFQNNDLKNLVISNSAASPGVTLGGALNLYGKLSFTGSNRTFTTSGNLTLRSTASGTASVGDITNNSTVTGNTITGDVTVERFITARRAWRFLSVPTQNNLQTIKEAWQENMPANSTTQSTPPGYGIHITKDSANWAAYGFDLQTTPGPSMKYFVPASNIWRGVTSTVDVPGVNNGRFETGKGYMVLVRGDRTANLLGSPVTTTTLRDKGALVTGTYGPVAVGAGQFAAIGNPYASAVNFSKMGKSNLQDVYYLWDPYLGTLGGYVTFAGPGYNPTANVSYPTNKFIESGQAFFVRSNGPAGTLTITEPAKEDGSYLVTRPTGPVSQLRTNLYLVDTAGRHLYDGVLSEFDELYSNGIDGLDAEKMVNFGENLGIKAGDKVLSVERHARLKETDTIHYNLGQVRVRNYQLEFVAEGLDQSGLAAFLEDRYLDTKTPVSLTGTTVLDFNVINEPGSYAPDRFRLVFRQSAPVPVTFTSIRANKHDRSSILVEWKVENELNIHHYELERSGDGRTFSKVNEQVARGNGSGAQLVYNWLDVNPLEGDNFYRVRSVGIGSDSKLSQVVKVNMGKLPSEIAVYPNPVQEDGVVNISLQNKAAGDYQVSLVNSKGQVVLKQVLNHGGGSSVYSIRMEKYLSHGNYMLNITGDDNQKLTFRVVF